MKKYLRLSYCCLLSLSALALFNCSPGDGSTEKRLFQFRYEIAVPPVTQAGSTVKLWIPLPKSDNYQTISRLTIESPVEVVYNSESVYDNAMAHLVSATPLPDGLNITLLFNVARKQRGPKSSSLTEAERDLYLAPTNKVPRDSRFTDIAERILSPGETVFRRGRKLYDYILDNMHYDKSGSGWGRGDAIYACDIGRGNCTDFHSFFNAVARAADIPARFLIGFPIPQEEDGSVDGYHCWAEFYTPQKGWIPVDISDADKHPELTDYLFGSLDPNRILFTVGRDIELVPPSSGGPVNFFIYPVLEIDGKRSDNYTKHFSFRDISQTFY